MFGDPAPRRAVPARPAPADEPNVDEAAAEEAFAGDHDAVLVLRARTGFHLGHVTIFALASVASCYAEKLFSSGGPRPPLTGSEGGQL